MLEVVDDITGLAFNPTRYEMTQQDDKTYFVKLNVVVSADIKYRYVRQSGIATVEYDSRGEQVRFRMAEISGPAIFQDTVSGWIDTPYMGAKGRVTGQLFDVASNSPVPNVLLCADGQQTVSASDGTFVLEGLATGTHTLVAYSMDGQYGTFQQGVVVAEGAETPVLAALTKRPLVNVTFNVTLPKGFTTDLPLRMATNLQPLGNAYADLSSGATMVAANLPVLTKKSNSSYAITLSLPAGFDLRYKFTLGDGLWNSELSSQGSFVVRQLLVSKAQNVNIRVDTFTTPGFAPVSFDVNTQAAPLSDEVASIQFNPFGWFEPIPMVKNGENGWKYTLYSPMNILGPVEFRFCRNTACDSTASVATSTQAFTPSPDPQTFSILISGWQNLQNYQLSPDMLVTDGGGLLPRPEFLTGFELAPGQSITSNAYFQNGLSKIVNEGSNFVIFSPTWTAIRNNPPILQPEPGQDISWQSGLEMAKAAHDQGLKVAFFPQIKISGDATDFWQMGSLQGWDESWYNRYQRFIVQAADWANLSGADMLILGDPNVQFSQNADAQWQKLIDLARSRFSGKIIGAYAYMGDGSHSPEWLGSTDGMYVLYSPPLSQSSAVTTNELIDSIGKDLTDNLVSRIFSLSKPVILGVNYPSAENALAGCQQSAAACMANWGSGSTDLEVQTRIYNAAVIAAAKQNWIDGFVSRGFIPEAAVTDHSSSLNGKPAMDILWFWYHFILNKTS